MSIGCIASYKTRTAQVSTGNNIRAECHNAGARYSAARVLSCLLFPACFAHSLLRAAFCFTLLSPALVPGIPVAKWFGREGDFNVLVMELLGPSLEDMFSFCHRKFSLKTVLLLAD